MNRFSRRVVDFDLQIFRAHIKGVYNQDEAFRFLPDRHELVPLKQLFQIGVVSKPFRSLGREVSGQAFRGRL